MNNRHVHAIPLGTASDRLACDLIKLTALYQSAVADFITSESARERLIEQMCARVSEMLNVTTDMAKALLSGHVKTELQSNVLELHLTDEQLPLLTD